MAKDKDKKKGKKAEDFKLVALENLFEEATNYARENLKIDESVTVVTPFGTVTVTKVDCPLPKAEFSINWQIGELWASRLVIKFLAAFHAKKAGGKESKIRVPRINPAMEKWLLANPEFVKPGMGKAIEIAADVLTQKPENEENDMAKDKAGKAGKEKDKAGKEGKEKAGKGKEKAGKGKEKAGKDKEKGKAIVALTEEQLESKVKLKTCKKAIEKIFEDDAAAILEGAFAGEEKTKLKKLVKAIRKAGFDTEDEKLNAKLIEFTAGE